MFKIKEKNNMKNEINNNPQNEAMQYDTVLAAVIAFGFTHVGDDIYTHPTYKTRLVKMNENYFHMQFRMKSGEWVSTFSAKHVHTLKSRLNTYCDACL